MRSPIVLLETLSARDNIYSHHITIRTNNKGTLQGNQRKWTGIHTVDGNGDGFVQLEPVRANECGSLSKRVDIVSNLAGGSLDNLKFEAVGFGSDNSGDGTAVALNGEKKKSVSKGAGIWKFVQSSQ